MAQGMRWGTASITTIARHDALYTARRAALYSQERLRVTNMTTTAKRAVLYTQDLLRVTNMTTTAPCFSKAARVCLCIPCATLRIFMLIPGGALLHHPRLRAI